MVSAIQNIYYIPQIIPDAEYHHQHSSHHHIASLFDNDVETNKRQSTFRKLFYIIRLICTKIRD